MMKGTRQWILVATFAMLAGFRFLDRTPGRWPPRFFTIIIPVLGVALVTFLAVKERVDAIRNKFGNMFPSPYPLWEFASLHNEDELFLLDAKGTAPTASTAAAR